MFHLAMKIPHKIYVAVSGGSDSMAVLDFLTRDGKRNVTVLNFNHGTEFGKESQMFVKEYCETLNIKFCSGEIQREKEKGESPEEYWRKERYQFFSQFNDTPIILAHHLNDAVETWVFSAIHGNPKLIPIKSGNIIRPFLLAREFDLQNWCEDHSIPFLDDPANLETRYPRVRIRIFILPEIEVINPGIYKVVKKKYLEIMKNGEAEF